MSTKNLMRALRAVHELDVQKAPKQHRLRTPQCPSLPRLAVALQEGWTPEEQEHVAGCPYCQEIIAMEGFQRVGAETELGRPAVQPQQLPRMLVQLLPIPKRLPESAFPRLAWTREPVRVGAGAFADAIPYQEFVSEDGQLTVIIQPNGEAAPGGAVLAVEVEDEAWAGGEVLVTLTNEEGTRVLLSERVAMAKQGGDLWEGSLPLTPERAGPLTEKVYMLAMREEPEL